MSRILKGLLIGLISFSAMTLFAQTQNHIVAIDETGSMSAVRSATGNTRWEDAIQIAAADLTQYNSFQTLLGRTLSVQVVTFNGSSWTDQTTGFVSYSSALTAINNLSSQSPSGLTPLAETLCGMADDLLGVGTGAADRSLSFYTDGGENNSSGQCDGTNGNLGDPAAWKTKVILKFQQTWS